MCRDAVAPSVNDHLGEIASILAAGILRLNKSPTRLGTVEENPSVGIAMIATNSALMAGSLRPAETSESRATCLELPGPTVLTVPTVVVNGPREPETRSESWN
jgi:hypothetical protein